tara:strand:- start:265 stop:480 length:216 start_codon:yes stop_codon:yes gene_type:complete
MSPNATVATNHERIVRVEEDVTALDERLTTLEKMHIEHIAKIDMIIQIGKIILTLVTASLGVDLGIQGGML